jgi:hypothetical protein
MALDTKFWCELDSIWGETNPTLSGSWVCVCRNFQQSRIFWTLLCTHEMQAIYLLAPIYFKHNLQHIFANRNYNYIVWNGANDFSTLIFWTFG